MKMLMQVFDQNFSSEVREISIIDSHNCFALALERIDDNHYYFTHRTGRNKILKEYECFIEPNQAS
jgi:hypothetical protein